MYPILFHVGDISIHTYGALGALGFLTVAFIAILRGRAIGISPDVVADLVFWTALVALVGSRLLYVYQNPDGIEDVFDVFNFRLGGLVFYGALLSGIPFATGWMLWKKLPLLATWDVFATAIPIGHGITRVGCFMAGCCWGRPTDGALGVQYTHPAAVAPADIVVHPVQLYEATMLMVIGLFLHLVYARKRFDGIVLGLYLLIYAAGRTITELFRGDAARGFFLPDLMGETLSYSQGISGLVATAGLVVLLVGWRRTT